MWIVRLALNRPYTFVVLAILILLLSPAVILRTPTDIFPNIDIPVISVAWTYTGLNPRRHTFRPSVGTMLAEMGEHQLTIRDYLRHSNLHVTNKYLQATSKTKRLAQDKLVDAILPTGILPKTNLIQ